MRWINEIADGILDIYKTNSPYELCKYLNIKIEKEIRNDVNRTANSETANISKTINAAVEQIKAIERVEKYVGLDNIPEDLREIAELRLKHKDLSLSELGALLNPPLSKSGVNHRMQKIMKMV